MFQDRICDIILIELLRLNAFPLAGFKIHLLRVIVPKKNV